MKKCIGVIELLNKDALVPFNRDDLAILELLSVQAGIAYQNASAYRQARTEIRELETAISSGGEFHQFVAADTSVLDLFKVIEQVAETNSSVLILGESGVGKELVAERIHLKSALLKALCARKLCGLIRAAFGKRTFRPCARRFYRRRVRFDRPL